MGKRKTTQTINHTYMRPPETADVSALRNLKATADPSIPYNFAKMRQQQANSFNNPLGSATSAATREASSRATNQAFSMAEAQANQESQWNADNQNFQRQAVVAGYTQPQLVSTGGTTTQSGGFWSSLLMGGIGAGAQLGSAALT